MNELPLHTCIMGLGRTRAKVAMLMKAFGKQIKASDPFVTNLKANRKIILIGGAPATGKSYIAKKLADELKIPWISTDSIRGMMLRLVNEADYPALFYLNTRVSNEFIAHNSSQEVVRCQNEESLDTWKGVEAFIDSNYAYNNILWDAFVIEGIAILPEIVAQKTKTNENLFPIFLADNNCSRIRKIIFERGLWSDAKKYPDCIKEKEVEWVMAFNDFIRLETKKYGLPLLERTDDSLFKQVLEIIQE